MTTFEQIQMVFRMTQSFPRLAPGHGSRHEGQCNAQGCKGEGTQGHFQDRFKMALRFYLEHDYHFSQNARLILAMLAS